MIGKYLNSWSTCGPRPEYDTWTCVASGKSNYSLVDPWINENGTWGQFTGYQPDLLADRAIEFIASTPDDQPFYVMYSPTTPHLPADGGRYGTMKVPQPRGPGYDAETRTSETPFYLRRGPLTPEQQLTADSQYRQMGRGTRALDDSIAPLLAALGDRAANTLVIFISDNGYQYGEQRRIWKASPFEPSLRVPMAIRYPAALPVTEAFATSALVGNVDIAPTIADAAGIPWEADGRSLLPLLTGSASAVRDSFFFSRCRGVKFLTDPCRGLGWYPERQTTYPAYEGVVTDSYKLIRYSVSGELQLFDLVGDPGEAQNLAYDPAHAPIVEALLSELDGELAPPPVETTLVSGPSGVVDTRTATFRYFSQSRLATYECRLTPEGVPGTWHACNGQQVTEGGLVDGSYLFEVRATDETGTTDFTPASRAFEVTSSGPPVLITSAPSRILSSSSASFAFESTSSDVKFGCRLYGWGGAPTKWAACDSAVGVDYSSLEQGVWNFEVRARDLATGERTSPPAAWLFDVDTSGPGWIFGARPATVEGGTTARFAFAPTEGIVGTVTCRLDGGASSDCTDGRFSRAGLTAGYHALTITASDVAGNVSSTKVVWKIDLAPPVVSFDSTPPTTTANTYPSFRLASSESSSVFWCQLDAWPAVPCKSVPELWALEPGPHSLMVRAIDKVGNLSAPLSYFWTIL